MRRRKFAMLGLAAAAAPLPMGGALASGGSGGDASTSLHLLPMDKVEVPIVDADRMSGTLQFKLVLDVRSAEAVNRLNRDMPQLRAATIAAGLEFARLDASGLRAVDVSQLDKELTAALKASDPDVVRVLIVEVGASQA